MLSSSVVVVGSPPLFSTGAAFKTNLMTPARSVNACELKVQRRKIVQEGVLPHTDCVPSGTQSGKPAEIRLFTSRKKLADLNLFV